MSSLSKSLSLLTLLGLLTTSCANKSIRVGDGGTRNGPLATVNGRITIGNECTIAGESRTVSVKRRLFPRFSMQ